LFIVQVQIVTVHLVTSKEKLCVNSCPFVANYSTNTASSISILH